MIKLLSRITQNRVGGLVGALLTVVVGLALSNPDLGLGLMHWSYDLPYWFRSDVKPEGVVIVYMDDESHRELKQPYNAPWDRSLHAQLIENLKAKGAKLIVLDILFGTNATPSVEADRRLAAAFKAHGKVIIGAEAIKVDLPGQRPADTIIHPVELLEKSAAGVGLVTLNVDADYGIRQLTLGQMDGPEWLPVLSWKAAQLLGNPWAGRPPPLERLRWLNYYGPPDTLPHVSYHLALSPDAIPSDFFKDKVVFVGKAPSKAGFSGEYKDEFRTPYTWFTRDFFSSGVEIHATAFQNLIQSNWLVRLPRSLEFLLLLLAGILLGYGLTLLRPLAAAGVATASVLLTTLAACLWFAHGQVWFDWLIIVAVQIPTGFAWSLLFNSVKLLAEKQVLEQSLALHLSPARVRQILKRPELLRPGAQQQEISVMFSDIANFSKITGRMEAEDLFTLLNSYFETALGCVHQTDGTVVKLIGDAIFAIWNAPFEQPDQQERACRAALRLRDQLILFDLRQQSLPLRTRVGLHTGRAFVGNVGSSTRFDYTAIGDAINLASRLEGLNKYLGTDILATRDIQKVVEKSVVSRLVGHFKFKGFDRIVEVHELIGTAEATESTRSWRETFTHALFHFQRASWDAAEAGFRRTLEIKPGDGPAEFYLEKLKEYRPSPPPADWTGEVEIKEK
jgi:adenylate cyclase